MEFLKVSIAIKEVATDFSELFSALVTWRRTIARCCLAPYSLYYGGLKFVPLGFKRLLILQSVNKLKLNLSSCSFLANLTLVKHDDKFKFTL